MFESRLRRLSKPATDEPGGVWTLDDERLVQLTHEVEGPAVVLVPSEHVLLTAADLPLAHAEQRRAAAPFAIEERVSEPLDALHVAVGAPLGGAAYMVGAVSRERMQRWVASLEAAGLPNAALTPDALALTVPEPDVWSVAIDAGRARVRTADGGFALPVDAFRALWVDAGRPRLVAYGAPVDDEELSVEDALAPAALAVGRGAAPALDLRQGEFAAARRSHVFERRLALVAGLGVAALLGLGLIDTLLIEREAMREKAALAAAVEARAPGLLAPDPDKAELVAVSERLLPGGAPSGGFLPVMSRAAVALQPQAGRVSMQKLDWVAAEGLAMTLDAPDLAALRQAEGALIEAGLPASTASAGLQNGQARGEIAIAAGAPGA